MAIYRGGGSVVDGSPIGGTDPDNADINGGAIDGTIIGANSAAAGTFTALTSNGIDDNGSATTLTIDTDNTAIIKLKEYNEVLSTNATATGAVSVNCENGPLHNLTLTGNVVFSFTNPVGSGSTSTLTLVITQDGTGGRTITWPAAVKWAGGTAPTLTTTASAVSILTFFTSDGGTTWYGFLSGDDFS